MFWYCRYSFLNTLTIHSQEFRGKTFFLIVILSVFRLRFFLEILVFWSFSLKFRKSASSLEMCYWIAFKLHKTILHHNCYSITTIFSENCNFFNSQFTHFSTGVDVEFFTIFNFKLFKVLLMWKCITGLFLNFITFLIAFAALSQFSVKIT